MASSFGARILIQSRDPKDAAKFYVDNLGFNPDCEIRLGVSVEPPRTPSRAVPFGTRSFPLTYPALPRRALVCSVPTGL